MASLPEQVQELKGTTGALEALYEDCSAENRALRTRLACCEAELRHMAEQVPLVPLIPVPITPLFHFSPDTEKIPKSFVPDFRSTCNVM